MNSKFLRCLVKLRLPKKALDRLLRCQSALHASSIRCCSTQLNMSSVEFTDYEWHRKWMEEQSRRKMPKYFNFARDVVDRWARCEKVGERLLSPPALWVRHEDGSHTTMSFQDISTLSKKLSNALVHKCGLKQGDTLIVVLPRIPEWWIVNIAAIRSGIITSPGTVLLREKDVKHRLNNAKAKCIIADHNTVDSIDKVADQCPLLSQKIYVGSKSDTRPGWLNFEEIVSQGSVEFETANTMFNDPMTLFFTSGTTGAPKMAEHTHGSYGYGHIITARYLLQANQHSMVWNMADTGWAKCAWGSLFAPWLVGAGVFVNSSQKFDPEQTLQILNDNKRIDVVCTPPTALRFFVQLPLNKYNFHNLRCIGAGEPVNPELLEEWKDGTGLDLYEGYGQTETTFVCGTYPIMKTKPGSMGKAAPGVDLQIVDDDGKVLPPEVEGNIGINTNNYRPLGLFARYVDDEQRTASVFRGGFYLTGDRAKIDEEGYFWFIGRADDVILTSGYRIGPFEVESALLEHHAVLESAVVSSPDDVRGEVVKAFVILTDEYKNADREQLTNELQEFVKSITAPYKYPRKIEFTDELPKTISGKIRRVELRQNEWKHHHYH